jgi:hypothetical protein
MVGALWCNCADAVIYRNKQENKRRVPELISNLDMFAKKNKIYVTSQAFNVIQQNCYAVIDEAVKSVTIDTYGLKVKLCLNAKGILFLAATHKTGFSGTL